MNLFFLSASEVPAERRRLTIPLDSGKLLPEFLAFGVFASWPAALTPSVKSAPDICTVRALDAMKRRLAEKFGVTALDDRLRFQAGAVRLRRCLGEAGAPLELHLIALVAFSTAASWPFCRLPVSSAPLDSGPAGSAAPERPSVQRITRNQVIVTTPRTATTRATMRTIEMPATPDAENWAHWRSWA